MVACSGVLLTVSEDSASDHDQGLVERPSGQRVLGDLAVVGRIAERDQHVGALVGGAVEQLAEEAHRRGGVGQGAEPGGLRGGQEHPGGDADRLVGVVGLAAVVGGGEPEDHDQPRRDVEVLLDVVGAERGQVGQPLLAGAVGVELALLGFGALADAVLDRRILHRDEAPRLLVRARRRGRRAAHQPLDGRARHRAVGEHPDAAAGRQHRVELLGRLLGRTAGIVALAQRNEDGVRHGGEPTMGRLSEASWRRTAWLLLGLHLVWRTVRWAQGFPIWGDEAFVAVNFWDRGYGDLVAPLEYGQIGPLFWLWLEKLMFDLFGPWERALRLPAFLAGIGSALLFFRLAFRILPLRAAVLGFAVFAASYYPVRHGAELKPYSTDLLVALAMFSLAWDWLKEAHRCAAWKKVLLVALTVLGPWISLPSMFVAGGCLVVLGVSGLRRGGNGRERRAVLLGYPAWGLALAGSAWWMVTAFAGPHAESASWLKEMAMWTPTFPPVAEPWKLPLWFLERHCGYMAAYPTGGRDWGSSLSFLLMAIGAWRWARRGRGAALALLTLPLFFNFVAAAMERYPYGGSVRVSLYFAPAACLLMGTALDALLRGIGRAGDSASAMPARGDRGRMAIVLLLAAFAGLGVVRDLIQPHKLESDRRAQEFALELADLRRSGEPF